MSRQAALPFLVEEEFLLLPVPRGLRHPQAGGGGPSLGVLAAVDDEDSGRQPSRRQVAGNTPLCRSADEVREALVRQRLRLAEAAEHLGAVLVPVGVALGAAERHQTGEVKRPPADPTVSALTGDQLVNSMSVHVQLSDRETGVRVMNRLRPWLHVLLALSANSPIWHGRDTGFASWRAVLTRTWPASGPPPYLADVAGYDRQVERFHSMGVIPREQGVNWTTRLSDRLVGVEIGVADVQLDPDSAVMVAELVRVLVARALRDTILGVLEPRPSTEIVQAACWHAARCGPSDRLIDLSPSSGTPRPEPVADVAAALLSYVEPVSDDAHPALAASVANVLADAGAGSGAARQRRAWEDGGLPGVLGLTEGVSAVTSVS